ncbi:putative disease resistance protein [Senna tora]|uniref:Putative disease resistance protein n=1 Tax=Senna tora TaxID=362788 RepID=A0A834XKK7_9FABA|nr:putative disease resistance protein [Senna tora]
MAGSGKTSLILKVLNSPAVRSQLYPIIWLCLSDINSKEDAEYEVNIVKFILCEMGCDVCSYIGEGKNVVAYHVDSSGSQGIHSSQKGQANTNDKAAGDDLVISSTLLDSIVKKGKRARTTK